MAEPGVEQVSSYNLKIAIPLILCAVLVTFTGLGAAQALARPDDLRL